MIRRLQKRYALSEQGAKDLIKGCFACVLQNISFMFPVGLLYCMVSDLMNGGVPGKPASLLHCRLYSLCGIDLADNLLPV